MAGSFGSNAATPTGGHGPWSPGDMPFPFPFTRADMIEYVDELRTAAARLEEEARYLTARIYGTVASGATDPRATALFMVSEMSDNDIREEAVFWELYKRGYNDSLKAAVREPPPPVPTTMTRADETSTPNADGSRP